MKRRAFFGGLFGAGAAAATVALPALGKPVQGVWWTPKCPMRAAHRYHYQTCDWIGEPIFVDLTKPVHVANQCPRCLCVMDLSDLGEQIRTYNKGRT